MKTLSSSLLLLCLLAMAPPALAQRRNLSGQPEAAPTDRQITPRGGAVGAEPSSNGVRPTPTCDEVRRRARYNIYFDKVDIEKLVQTVADATCRTFILPENIRGKISILGPENGRLEVNSDEFYGLFLTALDINGLATNSVGNYVKIVDKRAAKQYPGKIVGESDTAYTLREEMITKIFRIKNVEVEPLRGVLQQLVSKDGDTIPYPPDIIIVNDIGANVHRLERLINQLDTRSASDEVRIIQVQYATAADIATTVQKLFEQKGASQGGGQVGRGPRGTPAVMTPPGGSMGETLPQMGSPGQEGASGPVTFSQMIPDERTNKLIVVASPAAFERIQSLVRELDVPTAGTEKINVYPLENANSEEIASTLQTLSQGTTSGGGGGRRAPVPVPGAPGIPRPAGSSGAELFSGEVKISADKGTNSLVIIASQSDYRSLVKVIRQLDKPRRQVFVEAVIMEVNLDRNNEFAMNLHSGYSLATPLGTGSGLLGTKYTSSGLPPSFSLANLASFGGFLAGLQGPVIPELKALGIDIPSFGLVLHAFQQSSDVNVLSTPHLLTSDNEEAEITVGQNVPFQSGFSPTSLGTGAGLGGALGGTAGVGSLLGSLGGLGSLYAPITRQNVELKLTIKPQINESDFIRMAITEQTEEIASTDPVLGPTTSKRSAKTTVVAKDQETVVIGGIMQERTIESVAKVPVLGDIPVLGHLFRSTNQRKAKTNLLLFLTPYIIRDQSDFRRIFQRKMAERQQFVEQFYGQVAGYDVPVDFARKSGPLGRMRRVISNEELKLENGGPGQAGERILGPSMGSPASPPSSRTGEVPASSAGSIAPGPTGEPAVVAPPSPPENPEELRLQPDTGDQR